MVTRGTENSFAEPGRLFAAKRAHTGAHIPLCPDEVLRFPTLEKQDNDHRRQIHSFPLCLPGREMHIQ